MKKIALVAFSAASLLAVAPAFAQSSTTSTNTDSQSQAHHEAVRQQLMQNLQKDGFSDVHVIADSFLVHAKNKQGEPVVMIINPDSVFSETLVSAQNNTPAHSQQTASNK